jgi:hypothetical protein
MTSKKGKSEAKRGFPSAMATKEAGTEQARRGSCLFAFKMEPEALIDKVCDGRAQARNREDKADAKERPGTPYDS